MYRSIRQEIRHHEHRWTSRIFPQTTSSPVETSSRLPVFLPAAPLRHFTATDVAKPSINTDHGNGFVQVFGTQPVM